MPAFIIYICQPARAIASYTYEPPIDMLISISHQAINMAAFKRCIAISLPRG